MKIPVAKLNHPPKMDQLNLEKVEVIASMGLIDEQIAVILNISVRTLNYWKKRPEFSQALKRGKLKADFQVTQSLYKKALGGDTTACIFWLKNRQPDKWRDRQEVDAPGVESALYEISNRFLPAVRRGEKTRSDEPK